MADSFNYNGDDLLQKFKELNINLGGLDPNVVRAWYDTDDQDMINFLNFICSALTKDNVISPQELEEFQSIETPLRGAELEKAVRKLEEREPGIFDYELNAKQLEVSLAELELLNKEEQRLDELLKADELVQQSLSEKKLRVERESVQLDFMYREAANECMKLAEEVDEKNRLLHEKLSRDVNALASFHSENSEFLNRKNLNDIKDSFEFSESLEALVKKQQDELSGFFSLSNINLNSTPTNEHADDNLVMLQNKIYSSYMKYMEARIEEESLIKVNNFLQNYFTYDHLDLENKSISDLEKQKEMLMDKLRKKAEMIAEEPITLIKIKKLEIELDDLKNNLHCLSQISKCCSKLLNTTECTLTFLLCEKSMIKQADQDIRRISKYILNNLEDTKDRTRIMLNRISDYQEFIKRPLEQRSAGLSVIVDLYGETTLKDAYLKKNKIENHLKALEHQIFFDSNISETVNSLYKRDVVKEFLACGPTRQTIIIPRPVLKSLKSIKSNLDKQNSALKSVLQISNQTLKKLSSDKWLKNSRLIWVYFLVAPKKMKEVIAEMEEDLKKKEVKAVKFKE